MSKDPRPRPMTGRREPDHADSSLVEVEAETKRRLATVWVDHPPQMAIINRLLAYRLETLGQLGSSLDGRRLSQATQAGKSAIAWRAKRILAEQRVASGIDENPFQVLIVTIKMGMTIKGFLTSILKQMDDRLLEFEEAVPPFGKKKRPIPGDREFRSIETLEQRVSEWVRRLGTELIIVEEVQRLEERRKDAQLVTEQFQTMLDRGVAPLVLTGTEKSATILETNRELCARLSTPLVLDPVAATDEHSAKMFQDFCERFDQQLVDNRIFRLRSDLDEPEQCVPLRELSGGHVGRVARLVKEAAVAAKLRGAEFVEPFDLFNATQDYALSNGWVNQDWLDTGPFSRPLRDVMK